MCLEDARLLLRKKILEKLLIRSPDESVEPEDSHYELGLELARQGRHDEAVSELQRALQTGENLGETYLALGRSYEVLGRTEKAIKAYSQAIRIKADLTEGYRNLGLAYDRSGQFLNAIRMHMKAIRLSPDDVELRKNLGFAYFNVGSYSEAIKAYKQALELNSQDAVIHYNLGLVYLDLEDWEAAVQCQKAITELGETAMATNLTDEIDRQILRNGRAVSKKREVLPSGPELASAEQNGFTVFELLIVLSIISVVSGFALMQITRARQVMIRENAARQFAGYLEKARVDSLRRHPMTSAQMAQVSIINATFYTVTIDANGDGAVDSPTVVSLAPDGLQLNGPFPRTIYFNWRGRTVDAAGNVALPSFVTISNTLSSRIDLTTEGQPSLSGAPVGSAVNNSAAPSPSLRPVTQFTP
jgi:prepilin-type N-terminal cleavage/methylation domain-containing protein